jgi:phage gpG-like protein
MARGFTLASDLRRLDARVGLAVKRWTSIDLEKVGAYAASKVRADSMASFRNQADPSTGAPWKPSKRATGAFKRATAKFQAGKRSKAPSRGTTLEGTGRLKRSMRAGYEVLRNGVVQFWGGTVPLIYAAIHQFGGLPSMAPGPAAIPARPYVGMSSASKGDVQRYARKTMAGGI